MSIQPASTKNLKFFSYDIDQSVVAADSGKGTVSDWNRYIVSEHKSKYFINGVNLKALRQALFTEGKCEQLAFKDANELEAFFITFLFKDLPTDKAEIAAKNAVLQWHQGGIQHATYRHTWVYAQENFSNIKISDPIHTIYFASTPDGVSIVENNAYPEWTETFANGTIKKHKPEKDPFCIQTNTTYLFTAEGIQLQDLSIYCSNPQLNQIFDKNSNETLIASLSNRFFQALYAFIARFISGYDYTVVPTVESDGPQTEFTHPKLTT